VLALQVVVASPLLLAFASSPKNNNNHRPSSSCLDDTNNNEVNNNFDYSSDHYHHDNKNKNNNVPRVEEFARGGAAGGAAVFDNVKIDNPTRDVILRFLHNSSNKVKKKNKHRSHGKEDQDTSFHIQGWRWHFMSLIRDARRLERLSIHLATILRDEETNDNDDDDDNDECDLDALHRAANYVINFNMAGLYRIQSGMFLSFLRDHLCDIQSLGPMIGEEEEEEEGRGNDLTTAEIIIEAFTKVVDTIDDNRVQSEAIGRELVNKQQHAILLYILCVFATKRPPTL
jgi:hypothetical protein